jgi:hypothetical protein
MSEELALAYVFKLRENITKTVLSHTMTGTVLITRGILSTVDFSIVNSDTDAVIMSQVYTDQALQFCPSINIFPTEPVIMALLFSQHKLIQWLEVQIQRVK